MHNAKNSKTFSTKEKLIKNKAESEVEDNHPLYNEIIETLKYNEDQNELNTSLLEYNLDFPSEQQIFLDVNNKYYYVSKSPKLPSVRISNFLILPLYRVTEENKEIKLVVKVISNKESNTIIMDAASRSNPRVFKTLLLSSGDFNWKGTPNDLEELTELLMGYTIENIVEIDYIGWNTSEEGWFFQTHAYLKGQIYFPNKDGIFTTPTKSYLIKKNEAFNLPVSHINKNPNPEEIKTIINNYIKLYGVYGWLNIGFVTSTFQVSYLTEKTKQFPFINAYGWRNTGKTEIMRSLFAFAGIESKLPPPPSFDGLRKMISWYSHLPIGYDEAEQKSGNRAANDFFTKFREVLNTIFMRTTLERGAAQIDKMFQYLVRGTLVFGGENRTTDGAITTRLIQMNSLNINHNHAAFKSLQENQHILHWIGQYFMRTSHQWRSKLLKNYDQIHTQLEDTPNISSRILKNYATLLAGAMTFTEWLDENMQTTFCNKDHFEKMIADVKNEMIKSQKHSDGTNHLFTFLEDLSVLVNEPIGGLNPSHYRINDNVLYIIPVMTWGVYSKWKGNEKHYSGHRGITEDLKSQSYYMGMERTRIGGTQYRCWTFDLNHPNLPMEMKIFAEK